MPAIQRGQAYRIGPNRWGLRYYDAAGKRRRKSPFPSKSAALAHYRDVIEPELRGEVAPAADLTLAELVELYLERHAASVRPRTIETLRERLRHALAASGTSPSASWSGCLARSPPGRRSSPRGRATDRAGAQANAQRRRTLGSDREEPSEARRSQPPALAARGAGLHPRGDRRDRRGAAARLSTAARLRGGDRAAARGVAGAGAARHRSLGFSAHRPPHRLQRRGGRAGQDRR